MNGGDDVWEPHPLKHLSVGKLVLPADVEDAAKTPVMELLELLFMSPVDGPGFTPIQKYGQDDCHVDFDSGALRDSSSFPDCLRQSTKCAAGLGGGCWLHHQC